MKHDPISLPAGGDNLGDRLSEEEPVASGETVAELKEFKPCPAEEAKANFLRVFGVDNPIPIASRANPPAASPAGVHATRTGQEGRHPSTATLKAISDRRLHHLVNGHTPESDRQHGSAYFWDGAEHYFLRAMRAKTPETRRSHLISAISILVALADRDFHQSQEDAENGN